MDVRKKKKKTLVLMRTSIPMPSSLQGCGKALDPAVVSGQESMN